MAERLQNKRIDQILRKNLPKFVNEAEGGKKVRAAEKRRKAHAVNDEGRRKQMMGEALRALFSTDTPDDAVVEYVARNIASLEENVSSISPRVRIGQISYETPER